MSEHSEAAKWGHVPNHQARRQGVDVDEEDCERPVPEGPQQGGDNNKDLQDR